MSENCEITIIERKGGNVLLAKCRQFYKVRAFKDESRGAYWRCSMYKKLKCCGSVTVKDMQIIKEKQHSCQPNYGKNEIAETVVCLKNQAASTDVPMPQLYKRHEANLRDRGYDLIDSIPSFDNLKHALYNARHKSAGVSRTTFSTVDEVEVPDQFLDFMLGCDTEKKVLIFCTSQARKIINDIDEFFGDGTFKCSPHPAPPREGANIHGLFMEGARWDTITGGIVESRMMELFPVMPVIFIKAVTQDKQETRNVYECPVYKIRMRGPTFVWTFNLKTRDKPTRWTLAGVALLLGV